MGKFYIKILKKGNLVPYLAHGVKDPDVRWFHVVFIIHKHVVYWEYLCQQENQGVVTHLEFHHDT